MYSRRRERVERSGSVEHADACWCARDSNVPRFHGIDRVPPPCAPLMQSRTVLFMYIGFVIKASFLHLCRRKCSKNRDRPRPCCIIELTLSMKFAFNSMELKISSLWKFPIFTEFTIIRYSSLSDKQRSSFFKNLSNFLRSDFRTEFSL